MVSVDAWRQERPNEAMVASACEWTSLQWLLAGRPGLHGCGRHRNSVLQKPAHAIGRRCVGSLAAGACSVVDVGEGQPPAVGGIRGTVRVRDTWTGNAGSTVCAAGHRCRSGATGTRLSQVAHGRVLTVAHLAALISRHNRGRPTAGAHCSAGGQNNQAGQESRHRSPAPTYVGVEANGIFRSCSPTTFRGNGSIGIGRSSVRTAS